MSCEDAANQRYLTMPLGSIIRISQALKVGQANCSTVLATYHTV